MRENPVKSELAILTTHLLVTSECDTPVHGSASILEYSFYHSYLSVTVLPPLRCMIKSVLLSLAHKTIYVEAPYVSEHVHTNSQ